MRGRCPAVSGFYTGRRSCPCVEVLPKPLRVLSACREFFVCHRRDRQGRQVPVSLQKIELLHPTGVFSQYQRLQFLTSNFFYSNMSIHRKSSGPTHAMTFTVLLCTLLSSSACDDWACGYGGPGCADPVVAGLCENALVVGQE